MLTALRIENSEIEFQAALPVCFPDKETLAMIKFMTALPIFL